MCIVINALNVHEKLGRIFSCIRKHDARYLINSLTNIVDNRLLPPVPQQKGLRSNQERKERKN